MRRREALQQEKFFPHRVGAVVTRALLSPRWRSNLSVRGYVALYSAAKRISERQTKNILSELIQPGMVIFDVGANVGYYSRLMARLVGSQGAVYAFEPDPLSFSVLRDVSGGSLHAENIAVGSASGLVSLYCGSRNRADNRIHASHVSHEVAERYDVKIISLDEFCPRALIHRLDGLKIDIQGAEVAALRGMSETVSRLRPKWMLIEFSPYHLECAGSTPEEFWEILGELGYTSYEIDPRNHRLAITDTSEFSRRFRLNYVDILAVTDACRPEEG